jgi:hypothetical protein
MLRKTPLRRTAMKRSALSPLKRTKLRPMSPKRQKESREYARLRKLFLAERPHCELFLSLEDKEDAESCALVVKIWGRRHTVPRASEVHHKEKRGKNYLNVSTWAALSPEGHRYVEDHKTWARETGWLA